MANQLMAMYSQHQHSHDCPGVNLVLSRHSEQYEHLMQSLFFADAVQIELIHKKKCQSCKLADFSDKLEDNPFLLCDSCPKGYHAKCLLAAPDLLNLPRFWWCPVCEKTPTIRGSIAQVKFGIVPCYTV